MRSMLLAFRRSAGCVRRIMLGARALLLVNCFDALGHRPFATWRELAPEKFALGWRELLL